MYPIYQKCAKCGQIEPQQTWISNSGALACPHCEALEFSLWPDSELQELLNFALSLEPKQPRYSQIVSVFCCTTFEILLEQQLSVMLFGNMLYEEVSHLVEALLESHQGRGRLLELYKRMGDGPLFEEALQLGFKNFRRNWDDVVVARNKFVHGTVTVFVEPELIKTTILEGLELFRVLHNKYNEYSLHYTCAMEPLFAKRKELEKLE